MPANECKDCERDFPGGEGLIDDRCPSCHAEYQERHREADQPTPGESPEGGLRGFLGRRREEQPAPAEPPEEREGE